MNKNTTIFGIAISLYCLSAGSFAATLSSITTSPFRTYLSGSIGTYASHFDTYNYYSDLPLVGTGPVIWEVADELMTSDGTQYVAGSAVAINSESAFSMSAAVLSALHLSDSVADSRTPSSNMQFYWSFDVIESTRLRIESDLSLFGSGSASLSIYQCIPGSYGSCYLIHSPDLSIAQQTLVLEPLAGYYRMSGSLSAGYYDRGPIDAVGGGSWNVTISAVPVPPALWLFGSGLLGLISVARRKA